jgi:ATP-dependent RNA helicase DHX29
MQAKAGSVNVHDTSRIPEAALALLLGEAEVKMYSGVVSIDAGRIRLAVGNWKEAMAIKKLRMALAPLLERSYRRPGESLAATDQQWLDTFLGMTTVKEGEIVT